MEHADDLGRAGLLIFLTKFGLEIGDSGSRTFLKEHVFDQRAISYSYT
jgi:hypothetical protein